MYFSPMIGIDLGARGDAQSARSSARESKGEVMVLSQEVERLLMITEALWGFIREHHSHEDDGLYRKVIEIDARDGKVDGRVAATFPPQKCPHCDHNLPRRKTFCIYCGETVVKDCFER